MSEVKWIKLTVNVFDDEKFDAIKTLPDSNDLQLIWVKLLCLAGRCNENGLLMLSREIPYTDEMLANRFHMDVGVVQRAMLMFQKLEMIEVVENIYMVSNWTKYQSNDRLEEIRRKDRERKSAQKQALLEQKNNSTEFPRNFHGICSYSISYKNIENLYYILSSHSNYSNKEYLLERVNLKSSIEEWMAYKDERTPKKSNHYTEQGLKGFLTEIVKYSKLYGEEAVIDTINHTIAGQWQGLVWDWLEKKYPKIETQDTKPKQMSLNLDRPERWRNCPDKTWEKIKPYARNDGTFDWSNFDNSVLDADDSRWMRQNGM